jgi:hypothetical protein
MEVNDERCEVPGMIHACLFQNSLISDARQNAIFDCSICIERFRLITDCVRHSIFEIASHLHFIQDTKIVESDFIQESRKVGQNQRKEPGRGRDVQDRRVTRLHI